jgi:hypothetical protein
MWFGKEMDGSRWLLIVEEWDVLRWFVVGSWKLWFEEGKWSDGARAFIGSQVS